MKIISYCHPGDPDFRFRQLSTSPIPPWAADVKDEIPTPEEILFVPGLDNGIHSC